MQIKNLGGEFGLIDRIKKKIKIKDKNVVKGIGDDAAAIDIYGKNLLLLTTDTLVEDDHFSLKFSTHKQIGMKAIEQNVSDIAAMGGLPSYAMVSLSLPKDTDAKFVDDLYGGLLKKAKKYGIGIVGGNISHSMQVVINVSLVGFVEKKMIVPRSGARVGDLVMCSGDVGKSAAGLELLRKGMNGKSVKFHLEPRCRLDLARKLAKIGINSMIDVSDGVSPEVRHICEESNAGAIIYADMIPISKSTIADSKKAGKDALDLALHGGEDFELIFTAGKDKLNKIEKLGAFVIGEIVGKEKGIMLLKEGRLLELKGGFDHFG